MGKPAIDVRRGDERVGVDGNLHRVVQRHIDNASGAVTIAYDTIRPSGGVRLAFDVVPHEQIRTADTGFDTPEAGPPVDDFQPA
jgi:hypothetical protein